MINFSEIREMPEARRLFKILGAALVIWGIFFFLLFEISSFTADIAENVQNGGRVLNSALVYKSMPTSGQSTQALSDAEPLTVVSDILDTLELRDRVVQLQSNSSGVMLSIDKMYGAEIQEFLEVLESRGLRIRTAEFKSLPNADVRLMSAAFLLERGR